MNDTAGLVYDDDAAVLFAMKLTGLDERLVRRVLRSKDRYLLGMGIMPSDGADALGATPEELREGNPSLFPQGNVDQRYVSEPLQHAFIVRDSSVNEQTVAAILQADDEYMRRRGIID